MFEETDQGSKQRAANGHTLETAGKNEFELPSQKNGKYIYVYIYIQCIYTRPFS